MPNFVQHWQAASAARLYCQTGSLPIFPDVIYQKFIIDEQPKQRWDIEQLVAGCSHGAKRQEFINKLEQLCEDSISEWGNDIQCADVSIGWKKLVQQIQEMGFRYLAAGKSIYLEHLR
mgnify:CR=1 FL=1